MKPYIHKVKYYETDKMKLTHHSNYIRFMEEARMDFLEQVGWNYAKFEEEGVISPVVDVTCQYKKSTTYPDVISIYVRVKKASPAKFTLSYQMFVDETVVCEATSTHCFLNEKGSPVSIKRQYPGFYELLKTLEKESTSKL